MSSDNSKEAIQEHIRVYMMVFGALAVLTVITVLASFLKKVSTSEAIFLALIIASVKGLFSCWIFYASYFREKYDYLYFITYGIFLFYNDLSAFDFLH